MNIYIGNLPKDFEPPVITPKTEIRSKINDVFKNVDWTDQNWSVYDDEGFSIEFSLAGDEPVNSFTLHERGNGKNPNPGKGGQR